MKNKQQEVNANPKGTCLLLSFVSNSHFATFTFIKHESREWVKGKESKRLRDKELKRQRDKEAKGPFFETLMFMNLIHQKAINLFLNTKRAKCSEINEAINETINGH